MTPYWNDIVFGAIIAATALVRFAAGHRFAWMSWINVVIGAWIFASAFWLVATATAAWNDVILGVIVALLGITAAAPWTQRTAVAR